MSGLLDAILLGAGFSILSAGLAYIFARFLQNRARGAETLIWRSARLIAILPLVLAPAIYAVPQFQSEEAGIDWALEEPLIGHVDGSLPTLDPELTDSRPTLTAIQGATWIYFVGLVLFSMAGIRRHFWRRRVLSSSRLATELERSVLDNMAQKVGVSGPELRISTQEVSPYITGWRPVMMIPEALQLDRQSTRYAMLHELTHIKRGDEQDRLLGTALLTLLWFNWPLRWIEQELNAAREIACDCDVLKLLGGSERKPYAETLIHLMRDMSLPVSAFGPDNRRQREMRIKSILSTPTKRRAHKAVLVILLASSLVPMACAQVATTERRMASAPVEMVSGQEVEQSRISRTINGMTIEADRFISRSRVETSYRVSEEYRSFGLDPVPEEYREYQSKDSEFGIFAEGNVGIENVGEIFFSDQIVEGRVSSDYGPRPARPAGSPNFHGGVDIAADIGTSVQSASAGVVIHSQDGFGGSDRWGNTIVVDHGSGWNTIYAHLDTLDVELGQIVQPGVQIGTVGETGAATGPHVHLELRHNGERVDPADHIPGLN